MNINWNNLEKLTKISLNTKLSFGKYRGELVSDIVTYDANYIIYLYGTNKIEPDNELLHLIQNTINYKEKQNEINKFRDETWDTIFGD